MGSSTLERYFPIQFGLNGTQVAIKWLEFGRDTLNDPFFSQTVERLRKNTPAAREIETDITALLARASELRPIAPAGIIFHVSRCGSTLLSNFFRTSKEVVLLSEARPIIELLHRKAFENSPFPVNEWASMRRMLLDCVVTIFGHIGDSPEPKLVIKGNGIDILRISLVRSIWPDVPLIILIRNPIEVIVSILAKSAGWVALRKKLSTAELFGWSPKELQSMSIQEYCARALGRFYDAAAEMVNDRCRIVDYEDLTIDTLYELSRFLGLQIPLVNSPAVIQALSLYSKDPQKARRFESDRRRKQEGATDEIRQATRIWGDASYQSLKRVARAAEVRERRSDLIGRHRDAMATSRLITRANSPADAAGVRREQLGKVTKV